MKNSVELNNSYKEVNYQEANRYTDAQLIGWNIPETKRAFLMGLQRNALTDAILEDNIGQVQQFLTQDLSLFHLKVEDPFKQQLPYNALYLAIYMGNNQITHYLLSLLNIIEQAEQAFLIEYTCRYGNERILKAIEEKLGEKEFFRLAANGKQNALFYSLENTEGLTIFKYLFTKYPQLHGSKLEDGREWNILYYIIESSERINHHIDAVTFIFDTSWENAQKLFYLKAGEKNNAWEFCSDDKPVILELFVKYGLWGRFQNSELNKANLVLKASILNKLTSNNSGEIEWAAEWQARASERAFICEIMKLLGEVVWIPESNKEIYKKKVEKVYIQGLEAFLLVFNRGLAPNNQLTADALANILACLEKRGILITNIILKDKNEGGKLLTDLKKLSGFKNIKEINDDIEILLRNGIYNYQYNLTQTSINTLNNSLPQSAITTEASQKRKNHDEGKIEDDDGTEKNVGNKKRIRSNDLIDSNISILNNAYGFNSENNSNITGVNPYVFNNVNSTTLLNYSCNPANNNNVNLLNFNVDMIHNTSMNVIQHPPQYNAVCGNRSVNSNSNSNSYNNDSNNYNDRSS